MFLGGAAGGEDTTFRGMPPGRTAVEECGSAAGRWGGLGMWRVEGGGLMDRGVGAATLSARPPMLATVPWSSSDGTAGVPFADSLAALAVVVAVQQEGAGVLRWWTPPKWQTGLMRR